MSNPQFAERHALVSQTQPSSTHKTSVRKSQSRWVNTDDVRRMATPRHQHTSSDQPWMEEWNDYVTTKDVLPEDMSIVRWWGVSFVKHLCS